MSLLLFWVNSVRLTPSAFVDELINFRCLYSDERQIRSKSGRIFMPRVYLRMIPMTCMFDLGALAFLYCYFLILFFARLFLLLLILKQKIEMELQFDFLQLPDLSFSSSLIKIHFIICQVATAVNAATENSLVIVDEFGKGTATVTITTVLFI